MVAPLLCAMLASVREMLPVPTLDAKACEAVMVFAPRWSVMAPKEAVSLPWKAVTLSEPPLITIGAEAGMRLATTASLELSRLSAA